jgi:hypothetical protein
VLGHCLTPLVCMLCVGQGKGQNQLGLLLMKVRADERAGEGAVLWAKSAFDTVDDKKVR